MKKAIALLFAALLLLILTGCASPIPTGIISTNVTIPITATASNEKFTKIGTASCSSYFGLIAMGDASIDTAVKKGKITKIHHVEWKADNVLGIIGKYKVIVYGE